MESPSETFRQHRANLHSLVWAPKKSLSAWASNAARVAIDQLAVGEERAGLRHEVRIDAGGIVIHELVDLEPDVPICLVYEHPDGSRVAAFCLPWPQNLVRFVSAVVEGGLLVPDNWVSAFAAFFRGSDALDTVP